MRRKRRRRGSFRLPLLNFKFFSLFVIISILQYLSYWLFLRNSAKDSCFHHGVVFDERVSKAREDLDIANDTVQLQALATDIWQRKFDELAALVAGKVDGAAVAAIRDRSLCECKNKLL